MYGEMHPIEEPYAGAACWRCAGVPFGRCTDKGEQRGIMR
jgi:hypothetical protein